MTTYTTSWSVPLWAWPPLAAAVAAEAVSNALRAYGLGAHLERFTLTIAGCQVSVSGAVLVLAAIAVSLSQAKAAWVALTPGMFRQRLVAGVAAVLLLAVSVTAMASHILEAQRAKVADESGDRGKFDRAKLVYDAAAAELEKLKAARTMEAVKAAMDQADVSRAVFVRTKECTDMTRDDSFAACKPILDLRQEMAGSIRKQELEGKLPGLKTALDDLRRPEVASAVETGAAGVWGWLMGTAVVFVATFGSIIFARVDAATRDTGGTRPSGEQDQPLRPIIRPQATRSHQFTKTEVLQSLVTQLAMGDGFGSQDEMCERFRVPKSTLSEWLKQWRSEGLVPEGTKVGRRKALVAA